MVDSTEEIVKKLNILISIQKIVNSQRIKEEKDKIFRAKNKKKVYDLCNGKRTQKEIVNAFEPSKSYNKVQPLVSLILSELEEIGLVSYSTKGTEKIYDKIL
jgi:hypothetical protein